MIHTGKHHALARRQVLALLGVATISGAASARAIGAGRTDPMEKLIAYLEGTWDIVSERYPDSRAAEERRGRQVWKRGPGGSSLIEEFWSHDGRLVGQGTIWPLATGGYSVLWCDEEAAGCRLLTRAAYWTTQGAFVIEDERQADGATVALRETFVFPLPNQFVQMLSAGASFEALGAIETITAKRVS